MARVRLERGKDPELRALAEAVAATEGEEIERLRAWLRRNPPKPGTGGPAAQ